MNSPINKINWADLGKGLIMAALMSALTLVYQAVTSGGNIDLKQVGLAALGAAMAYLIKQFNTDSQGTFLGGADNRGGYGRK